MDYSQKRLIGAAFRAKGKGAQKLQWYAFLTGLMSTLTSFVYLILTILKR